MCCCGGSSGSAVGFCWGSGCKSCRRIPGLNTVAASMLSSSTFDMAFFENNVVMAGENGGCDCSSGGCKCGPNCGCTGCRCCK